MMSIPFTRRNEGILLLKLGVFVIRIEVSEGFEACYFHISLWYWANLLMNKCHA
jgi:hypothetical protein